MTKKEYDKLPDAEVFISTFLPNIRMVEQLHGKEFNDILIHNSYCLNEAGTNWMAQGKLYKIDRGTATILFDNGLLISSPVERVNIVIMPEVK